MTTSVMIVEDEPDFLRVLSEAVLLDAGLRLLAAVSTGTAALALLAVQPPDVVLVDLDLPDMPGVDVIRRAVANGAGCDALVVTMFGNEALLLDSIAAGAVGYLLKDASSAQIVAAIHEVHAGGSPMSPSIARRLLRRMQVPPEPASSAAGAACGLLSARETEVLRLTAKGLSVEEVGQVLAISPHTVVTHVKRTYCKLAVHSRTEAVFEASQLGLL